MPVILVTRRLSLIGGMIFLAACSSQETTVIDGSSAENFASTTAAAQRDLTVADRLDFDRAMASAASRRFGVRDKGRLERVSFDGMTGTAVVADYRERGR